jgi:hypothetical protein
MAEIDPTKLAELLKKTLDEATDQKYRDALESLYERLKDNADEAEAVATSFNALTESQRQLSDATLTLERGTERLIKTLTGVEKRSQGVIGGFARMKEEGKTTSEALAVMTKTLRETMTATNLIGSTVQKFIEASFHPTRGLTAQLENATAGFAKATGTGNKYKDVIRAAEFRNRRYGVSAEQAAKSTGALVGGFTEFLMMSEDAQKSLTTTVSSFEAIGVNAATTVKFLEAVTRTTGKTRQEALKLQRSVMATANAFGDDLNMVMDEAATLLPKLAIHGNSTERVLNNLYSASKRTGFAMADIVSFAERFDTFDSAADAAGNLNAVLGQMGGAPLVDTMQILETTDPAERMQLFSDAIEQSVGNYEDLDYYQQRAVANALGQSVEQTRMMMLQEEQTSSLDEAMKRQNLGQTEYNKLAKDARSIFEELKIVAMQFAVALEGPLFVLKSILGFVNNILDGIGSALSKVGLGKVSGIVKLGLGVGIAKVVAMGISKLTGGSLFGPNGSAMKPFHVIMAKAGALKGIMGKAFDKIKERFGFRAGREGPALPPEMGGGFNTPTILGGGGGKGKMFGRGTGAKASRFGKMSRSTLGRAGTVAGVGVGAYNIATAEDKKMATAKGVLGAIGGGVLGFFAGGPAGAYLGASTGFSMGTGMEDGGVLKAKEGGTPVVAAEAGLNEAFVPLPNGRQIPVDLGSGQGFDMLAAKLDRLITAVERGSTVLVKSDLEAAGFMNSGNRVAVT